MVVVMRRGRGGGTAMTMGWVVELSGPNGKIARSVGSSIGMASCNAGPEEELVASREKKKKNLKKKKIEIRAFLRVQCSQAKHKARFGLLRTEEERSDGKSRLSRSCSLCRARRFFPIHFALLFKWSGSLVNRPSGCNRDGQAVKIIFLKQGFPLRSADCCQSPPSSSPDIQGWLPSQKARFWLSISHPDSSSALHAS